MAATERSPLVLRAHFGSSRVRKTSRAISAKSAEFAPTARIFRPPPPTPVLYAGHAACGAVSGSETSDLLGPRPIAYSSTVLLQSRSINRISADSHVFFRTHSGSLERRSCPAGPRTPADLATLAPARGQLAASGNLGGNRCPQRIFRTTQRANQPRGWLAGRRAQAHADPRDLPN